VRAGKGQRGGLAALALLAFAAAAHADYRDNYAHGLESYNGGDYTKARSLIQQALDEHAEPAIRIRLYGQRFEPYLPQHFLGMSAFRQGDCAAAVAQWSSAQNRQIVSQLPDISNEEQRDSAECEQKGLAKKEDKPAKPPATAPPETAPPKATVSDKSAPKPVPDKTQAAKTAPPEPLVQAFDSYLAGRYSDSVRINPDSYADTRAKFHAYLVRAAAKYTLARLAGDDDMLKAARADALAARALDARTQPDATLFSPGFRAFYQDAR
jgi:hypothetical protein